MHTLTAQKIRFALVWAALTAAALFVLTGCATPAETTLQESEVTVTESTIVLDVRTPAEFAAGHLEGADLLDFTGGEVARALPNLDPSAEYLVYCRSGNRSAQAITLMQNAGFTNLTNLGSLEEAARKTGIDIVQ